MKKLLLIIGILISFNCIAQQKPPIPRTTGAQVVSDRALKVNQYFSIPNGPVPLFPSFVADSNKNGSLFLKIASGDTSLMIYEGLWKEIGTSLGKNIALNKQTPNPWNASVNSIDIYASRGMSIESSTTHIRLYNNAYQSTAGPLVNKFNGNSSYLNLSQSGFQYLFAGYAPAGTNRAPTGKFLVDSLGNESVSGWFSSQTPPGTPGTDSIVTKVFGLNKYGAISPNYYLAATATALNATKWNNQTISLSGLTTNDILQYNGTDFVNALNTYSTPLHRSGGNTSIDNAAANGTTKGAATFAANDFNDNGSGLITIDYTSGVLGDSLVVKHSGKLGTIATDAYVKYTAVNNLNMGGFSINSSGNITLTNNNGIVGGANSFFRTFNGTGTFFGQISPGSFTANRTYTEPDKSGTFAMTSDIPSYAFSTGLTNSSNTITVNYGITSTTATVGNDSRVNNGQTAFGWGNWASNFGSASGTIAQGNDSRINNGQTAFGWGNPSGVYLPIHSTADNSTKWNGYTFDNTSVYSSGSDFDYVLVRSTSGAGTEARLINPTGFKSWLGLSGTNTGDETTSRINALYGYTPANGANYAALSVVDPSATQTTINGTTTGSIICSEPVKGSSWKKVLIYINGLNSTTLTYTFPVAFTLVPAPTLYITGSGTIVYAFTDHITISGTSLNGWVTLEGY